MRLKLLFLILFFCCSLYIGAQVSDSIRTQQLSEIEVSAHSKPSTTLSTTPLQVMDSEELLKQGIQSVSDAVRKFNGIVLKDYGGIGGLKTVSIRGMGAEHTAISYDGVVVGNVQSGQVDIGRFALDNISVISLNIGQADDILQTARARASGGVLNLQTSFPELTNKNYKGHARVTGGSFGLFNPMLDYAQKINKNHSVSVNGSWQRADGNYPFTQKDDKIFTERKRENSDVDIFRTEINLYSNLEKAGTLKTKIYYFDSERGLPGAVVKGNIYSKERLWDKNFFAQIAYEKYLGRKFKLRSQAKYDYVYTRYEDDQSSGKTKDKYREQEVYLSNVLSYSLNDRVSFSFAEDLFYNKLKSEYTSKQSVIGDNLPYPERYNSLSALSFQYKSKYITVSSSLLATYISEKVKNNKNDNSYKKLSPAISLSYQLFSTTNLRLRTSYKQVYRVPTFTELYYSSVEKNLNPESAKQYNLGLTWVGSISNSPIDYISFSADGYINKVDDKIVIIPKTYLATTMNIGNADIKGIDVRVATNARINKEMSLQLVVSYSFIEALDVTSKDSERYKNQLPYTPKHSGATTLSFNNPWADLSYSVVITAKRYSMPINEKATRVDGYSDHSISLFRQFKIKNTETYLQGNVLNLWNKRYDVIKNYPMPGRSFKISAGVKF